MTNSDDFLLSEVIKNTINAILNIHIGSLDDINKGDELPKLVEKLDEKIDEIQYKNENWDKNVFKRNNIIQKNFALVKEHLSKKNNTFKLIQLPNSNKDMISLLKLLLDKLYIKKTAKELLNIVSSYLSDSQSMLPIKNMGKSWINGLPFIALLSKISNGSIKFEDKGDYLSNYEYILSSCNQLNIPFVLTKECISNKANEFCNCIQVTFILQKINNDQISIEDNEDEKNKKRFNEKTDQYINLLKTALSSIENEKNQIRKFGKCISSKEIQQKSILIHNFYKSGIQKCNNEVNNANELFETINRLSKTYGINIPPDLISFNNDMNNELNQLKSEYPTKNDVYEEEMKVKCLEEKISNINTLYIAKETFNRLKKEYDMDNWDKYCSDSFVYLLGSKLNNLENLFKSAIDENKSLSDSFNESVCSIISQIDEKTPELAKINDEVNQLSDKIYNIKKSCEKIKLIEPSYTIEIADFRSQAENAKKKFLDYQMTIFKNEAEEEINKIKSDCEHINLEIQKFDEYKNVYENDLYYMAKKEHPIIIPECYSLYKMIRRIDNDEYYNKIKQVKDIVNETRKIVNDAFSILKKKEEKSKKIEQLCYKIKDSYKIIKSNTMPEKIDEINDALKIIKSLEKEKDWDEKAVGKPIDLYNEEIKNAYEIIEKGSLIIKDQFDKNLNKIKNNIEQSKNDMHETYSITEDKFKLDCRLY